MPGQHQGAHGHGTQDARDHHAPGVDGTGTGTGASRWEDPRLVAARDVTALIGEAKQQLMRDHGLGPAEAFELLRHYSRTSDLPMRDVARKLVHDTWLPGRAG